MYWQVGSSADRSGRGSVFVGKNMALPSVTLDGGTLRGKALARNGESRFLPRRRLTVRLVLQLASRMVTIWLPPELRRLIIALVSAAHESLLGGVSQNWMIRFLMLLHALREKGALVSSIAS